MKYALYIIPIIIACIIVGYNNAEHNKRVDIMAQELESMQDKLFRLQDRQNNLILEVSTIRKGQH